MSETTSYENLIAGSQKPLVTKAATILSGSGVVARGTLLGKILFALGAITPGANTGGGGLAAASVGAKAKIGNYSVKAITAGPPATFEVLDPDGVRLGEATAGVAYVSAEINFTITAAGAAFIVGDGFTVAVVAGSGKVKPATLAAVDGSEVPFGVAAETVDATAADVVTSAFVEGEFAPNGMTFATGTSAQWADACAAKGIYLRSTISVGGQ